MTPNFLRYICVIINCKGIEIHYMLSKQLLKGTLQTIVLKLLEEHGRMYGYEITQHVLQQTAGKLELTEGALYPTLHKLEAQGFVVTEKEMINRRMRKYYRLTPKGETERVSKIKEFREFVQTMNVVLGLNLEL